jgi:hypothetical protein
MVRPLNRAASPLRLFLLLTLFLLGALLVGFSLNQPPIHNAGSQSQPASMFATEPNGGAQPAASAAGVTRIVTGSTQGPSNSAAPAAAEPAQTTPAGPAGCQANPPAGRGTPVICSNP